MKNRDVFLSPRTAETCDLAVIFHLFWTPSAGRMTKKQYSVHHVRHTQTQTIFFPVDDHGDDCFKRPTRSLMVWV